ncbi:MAG: helix-turn-helix domain-containing protein [Pseudolabrys sp.]|nr:helix-turn-helix domain-containing protein [Pseudolabrys sp.]
MSIQAVAWVLDREELPARPKLVLVAIANHANHTDGYCWLKAETIAKEAACSPRAVFNFVGALIRNGYIRKAPARGADGKQRANDYWILFNRPDGPWIKADGLENDDQEADETGDETADLDSVEAPETPQDAVEPHAPCASGEPVENEAENASRMHAGAVGPHAPACSHIDSAEPSKTNPEKAGLGRSTPRRYAPPPPPPPKPQGATTAGGTGDFIFVFDGTPAYSAWQAFKTKEIGRPWACRTSREGRWGWYFPTLFPPKATDPPKEEIDDLDPQFSKTG